MYGWVHNFWRAGKLLENICCFPSVTMHLAFARFDELFSFGTASYTLSEVVDCKYVRCSLFLLFIILCVYHDCMAVLVNSVMIGDRHFEPVHRSNS